MKTIGWLRTLGRLGALVAFLLVAVVLRGEVPQLRTKTLANLREADQGITKPLVVDRNGHRYVLKANTPAELRGHQATKYGNFEAEIVAFHVFRLLGLRSPAVRVVRVEGKPDLYLRITYADEKFSHLAAATPVNKTALGAADPLDLDAARKIALVDLLIGNPDRHEGNILLYKDAEGTWIPVPIDHNFALITPASTGVASWALKPIPAEGAPEAEVLQHGNQHLHFRDRNQVTKRAVFGADAHAALKAQAKRLKELLTDAAIARIVRSVPPAAIVGRPAEERFAELIEMLAARRDAIPGFLDRYFAAGGAP